MYESGNQQSNHSNPSKLVWFNKNKPKNKKNITYSSGDKANVSMLGVICFYYLFN